MAFYFIARSVSAAKLRHIFNILNWVGCVIYSFWTKRSDWNRLWNVAAVRAEISLVGLLLQYYTIASRNSQFVLDSVSIGLAAFPDNIYTDATLYTESKPSPISFSNVKNIASRFLLPFVGNRYINARLFRYADLIICAKPFCL